MTVTEAVPFASLGSFARLPLLLWLAGSGWVEKVAVAREFPATRNIELHDAFRALEAAGWLELDRGPHKGRHFVRFVPAGLVTAREQVEETLPGSWAAAELDLLRLLVERNLWRSSNRLAVLAAVRSGAADRAAVGAATGLSSSAVSAVVLDLLERGVVALDGDRLTYRPVESQVLRLVELLEEGCAS